MDSSLLIMGDSGYVLYPDSLSGFIEFNSPSHPLEMEAGGCILGDSGLECNRLKFVECGRLK